jgi:hypothetical protein
MRFFVTALLFAPTVTAFVAPIAPQHGFKNVVLLATIEDQKVADTDALLEAMKSSDAAEKWADMFGLGDVEKSFYSLFEGIRKEIPIGLRGKPFVLKKEDVDKAIGNTFQGFFTFDDLEKAVNDDFLDAGRGTTDNRKGWKVRICTGIFLLYAKRAL